MEEKTATQETQFGNLVLNELKRLRNPGDTIAILQFCVNVGILPDGYVSQLIVKRQPPCVPPQVQEQQKAGD